MKRLLIVLNCILIGTFTYCQGPAVFNSQNVNINSSSGYVSFNDLTSGTLPSSIGAGLFVQMGPNVSRDSFVNLKVGVTYKPGD